MPPPDGEYRAADLVRWRERGHAAGNPQVVRSDLHAADDVRDVLLVLSTNQKLDEVALERLDRPAAGCLERGPVRLLHPAIVEVRREGAAAHRVHHRLAE